MRLSGWRAKAPHKDSTSPRVLAVIEAALLTLGAEQDPECWVAWGDDPMVRYLLFAPTSGGLVQLNVRVNVQGEGPRASGKVVRWNRVQLGELGVEIQGGHRLVSFQVESQVLNGVDVLADAIAGFAQALFAAVDGRPVPPSRAGRIPAPKGRPAAKGATKSVAAKPVAVKSATAKPPPATVATPKSAPKPAGRAAPKGSAR